MATPVSKVSGIGPHTANVLLEHGYSSAESLAKTKIVDLTRVPGFGMARARKVIAAAQALIKTIKSDSAPSRKKPKKGKSAKQKAGKKKDKKSKKKAKAKKTTEKKQSLKTKKKKEAKPKKKKKGAKKK